MGNQNFGRHIKELRKQAGLTQKKLGELSDVSDAEISRIESNLRQDVSVEVLNKIAPYLNVSLAELLTAQGYVRSHEVKIGDMIADIVFRREDDWVIFEEKMGKYHTIFGNNKDWIETAHKVITEMNPPEEQMKKLQAILSYDKKWLDTSYRIITEMAPEDREKVIEYATFLLDKSKKA